MKKKIIATGLLALSLGAIAQTSVDGSHYAAGSGGIRGGSAPEPGLYLSDNNLFYTGTGGSLPNYKTFVYQQAPQLLWMTGWKFLDASLGMDLEIPIEYRQASYRASGGLAPGGGYAANYAVNNHQFGLGDIKLEPLILAWHWKHFDVTASYALWVPSANYSAGRLANLGDDDWANMISLGGVWYPDEKKTWAVSLLHHYEINSSQVGTTYLGPTPGGGYSIPAYSKIPCSTYTMEWAVSKTILDNIDVGLFGYYQKQFADRSSASNPFANSEVAGLGPEISATIPGWGLTTSVRYAYEFTAYDRPQGHTVNLSLTKKF